MPLADISYEYWEGFVAVMFILPNFYLNQFYFVITTLNFVISYEHLHSNQRNNTDLNCLQNRIKLYICAL